MKTKLTLLFFLAAAISAEAVVTLTIKNYADASTNGASDGLPIVNSLGVPVPQVPNTVWASAGYFTTLPDFATATATQVLSLFTAIDNAGALGIAARPGLFNAQDYNDAAAVSYPAGFATKNLFVIFGDAENVKAGSTKIAVFNSGTTFSDFTTGGAQTAVLNKNMSVYGLITPVTVQPDSDATPSVFVNGIQLVAAPVPEPSAALLGALGALGLLRRRRN